MLSIPAPPPLSPGANPRPRLLRQSAPEGPGLEERSSQQRCPQAEGSPRGEGRVRGRSPEAYLFCCSRFCSSRLWAHDSCVWNHLQSFLHRQRMYPFSLGSGNPMEQRAGSLGVWGRGQTPPGLSLGATWAAPRAGPPSSRRGAVAGGPPGPRRVSPRCEPPDTRGLPRRSWLHLAELGLCH